MSRPDRYGPAGFRAAALTTFLLEFGTCLLLLGGPAVILGIPVLAVVALVGFGMSRSGGGRGQIGYGILLGCLAPLVTVVFVVAAVVAAHAVGPL